MLFILEEGKYNGLTCAIGKQLRHKREMWNDHEIRKLEELLRNRQERLEVWLRSQM